MENRNRLFRLPVLALVLAAALASLAPTGADAAPLDQKAPQLAPFASKYYSVTATITNSSRYPLTLSDASLGHESGEDGGHWDDRPAATLEPGDTTTASAYAAVGGQAISVTYLGGVGWARLVAQDPTIGSNNTNGTKGTGGLIVNATITSGRKSKATFTIE